MEREQKIERHIYIAASPEKVWEALVTPEIASRYFVVPMMECEARAGGKIIYGIAGHPPLSYDVLECDPGRRLVHTFVLPSHMEDPPTRVIYEIEEIGDLCKLTMIHDGFPSRNATFEEVNGGWNFILSNLKTLLETGRTLSWPADRQTW